MTALFQEMEFVAQTKGRNPSSVYIGGGTPTSLTAEDLEKLLARLTTLFDCAGAREFTVEAGRPDSITAEKLKVLKSTESPVFLSIPRP